MVSNPNFPKLLKSFIIITLFAFVLLSIVLLFANNYNQDTTEIDNRIGLHAINSTLETTRTTAKGWQKTFGGVDEGKGVFSEIVDVLGLLSVGVFKLARGMATFIFTPFTIFSLILVNVLKVPIIVVNIIKVLIILGIIFGIWSLVKRGV